MTVYCSDRNSLKCQTAETWQKICINNVSIHLHPCDGRQHTLSMIFWKWTATVQLWMFSLLSELWMRTDIFFDLRKNIYVTGQRNTSHSPCILTEVTTHITPEALQVVDRKTLQMTQKIKFRKTILSKDGTDRLSLAHHVRVNLFAVPNYLVSLLCL